MLDAIRSVDAYQDLLGQLKSPFPTKGAGNTAICQAADSGQRCTPILVARSCISPAAAIRC